MVFIPTQISKDFPKTFDYGNQEYLTSHLSGYFIWHLRFMQLA